MATKVYVENLPPDMTEEKLKNVFAQFGAVEAVKIESDLLTRQPKGTGYVEMSLDLDAYRAVNCFNGATFRDRKILVEEEKPFYEWARAMLMNRFEDDITTTVCVENLPCGITEELLRDVFAQVGPVEAVKIQPDLLTRRTRCTGYVKMSLNIDAYRAANFFNGAVFRNRKIHVEEAKPFYEKAKDLLIDRVNLLAQYGADWKKQLPKWQ